MKSFITFFLFLLCPTLSFAQWELRNNGINLSSFHGGWSIDALDSNNAVVSYGELYKTTDGGLNWNLLNIPIESGGAIDVEMVDLQVYLFGTFDGMIYKTTDGGITWIRKFADSSLTTFINYIEMFDENNGIAMGDALADNLPAVFLKTTDGGDTWISVNNSAFGGYSGDIWRRLDFVDQNTGYFFESGMTPQKLYKTTTGGSSWTEVNTPAYCAALKFFNEEIGISANYNGQSYLTNNGSISWEQSFPFPGWPEDFEYLPNDASKTWAAADNRLFFSEDSGKTFSEQLIPTSNHLIRDLQSTDQQTIWLIADSGLVFRNTNGARLTDIFDSKTTVRDFELLQNYPNPFNPVTTINYSIPVRANVVIKVYDALGRKITPLVDEEKPAGTYEVNWNAADLPSGIYFYRLQAGDFVQTKKMILMK